MEYVAPIIEAIAWPAIVIALLWLAYPSLRRVLESRALHVKYGDTEFTIQDSTDDLRQQISKLQDEVAALGLSTNQTQPSAQVDETLRAQSVGATILWVDDRPSANAFERAKFEDDGYRIIRSTTTDDALRKLRAGLKPFVIISDMGRAEGGVRIPDAGIRLVKAVRQSNNDVPFFIYTGTDSARTYRQAATEAGADGITSSSVTLIRYIAQIRT